jgi:hypothetical protein
MTGMKMRVASIACAAVLSGCQTPNALYELAEKTSANAAVFQQHLGEMAAQSKGLAARRAEHVAAMDAFNAELDAFLKRELYMREKSLGSSEWSKVQALMNELVALRDELLAIEAKAEFARSDRRKAVLALHTELSTFSAAMRNAANALNALAKRESDTERARFLASFLNDVQKDVKKKLEENDDTAKAAKGLMDKIKTEFRDSIPTDGNDKK